MADWKDHLQRLAAESESELVRALACVPPAQWDVVVALARPLTLIQLRGFTHLLACGEHPETAANLLRRCPDSLVPEAAQAIGEALTRGRL